MSTGPSSMNGDGGEPPRKRIRKGTKSCWECKRRKIRCQLSSENVPVCSGCLARGTTCLSQEYPEEHDPPGSNQVGERLGRVEMLLEKLVSKIAQYEEEESAAKIATPESMGSNDVLTPYGSNVASNSNESPVMSIFDAVVNNPHHVQNGSFSNVTTPSSATPGRKTTNCVRVSKTDRLRQTLADMLPCQRDVDIICRESSCYLLMNALNPQSAEALHPNNNSRSPESTFNITAVSKQHPTLIAKSMMYITVCLQQLPATFDPSHLQMGSINARMDKYMSNVQSLITSDDELVSTVEGIECLLLQGIFHINGGNPRRAWLTFRRALNVGQLMGIHRVSDTTPGGRDMWWQIVQGDRYLALLLGLPAGSPDTVFGPDETFQNPATNKDILYARKLSEISTRIVERNQAENTHAYATTQGIDEKLESLAKKMPASWWAIPRNVSEPTNPEASLQVDRLMIQIWFFQLEALLHLPFMLRAATDRRYEYSKYSCLKASREMIHRYLALRVVQCKSFCCKVVDFGALTATVTIFLGLLDPPAMNESQETRQQKDNDRALVNAVLEAMEELSAGERDVVARQSVDVIKTLLAIGSPSASGTGNLRLTIPYFGTINIARQPQSPRNPILMQQPPQQVMPEQQTSQAWEGLPFPSTNPINAPMVSFTSSQFPPLLQEDPMQNWQLPEADTLFFDSLLNTDIEGNWIF